MSLLATRRRVVAAATTLVTGAGLLFLPQATASDARGDLIESVRGVMLTQRGPAALAAANQDHHGHDHDHGTGTLAEPLVEPTRSAAGTWAFGSTTIPLPSTAHSTPESALFVARRGADGWRVELDGTAGFVELARQAPESVVSSGEKELFESNYRASRAELAADTGLGLPWPQNVAWWMGGGPHGNSGNSRPFSSIDFNGGDGRVLSAGPGRVYKSCIRGRSALVKVVHPNGYSTTYYHMYDLTTAPDGTAVQTGTYLGHIGNELPCGGSSSGAHVHLSLLRGNTHISVHNMKIGGWTFFEGASAYGGYAERNGVRVGRGGRLTNYGPSGGEPGLPTGTVNGGANPTVNLRGGPGLSHAVVGTVANGEVVRIACTARGDEVDGVWGKTDLWNKLDTGSWISDGFVDTGSNEPVAPPCT